MNPRRALAAAALGVVAAAAFPMSSAYACSCASAPGDEKLQPDSIAFYGEVLRREVKGQQATYVVDVERVYAGDVGDPAEVRTHVSGATCGLEIPSTGPALFFAQRSGDGGLESHLCSGTRSAADPPKHLGPGREPAPASTESVASRSAPAEDRAVPLAAAFVAVAGVGFLVTRRPSAT